MKVSLFYKFCFFGYKVWTDKNDEYDVLEFVTYVEVVTDFLLDK